MKPFAHSLEPFFKLIVAIIGGVLLLIAWGFGGPVVWAANSGEKRKTGWEARREDARVLAS